MLHEELLKEQIIFNLEEKMIIASQYLKSCNKQDKADLFDVGFYHFVVSYNRYNLKPIQILGLYSFS